MLRLNGINKAFGGKSVLNNVSLTLNDGQITALVGSNGAGKSTLIGIMLGYYNKNGGEVIAQSISVMPDTHSIYDEITGYAFLKAMSQFKGLPDMSQALDLCQRLGLEKDLKKKIKSYSFGMRKKISFVQAAIGNFNAYIFDEPTSGVDAQSAREMLRIVVSIKEKGKAILLTSHNLDELEEVADYVYILDKGRVVNEGTVKQIIESQQDDTIFVLKTPDVVKLQYLTTFNYRMMVISDDLVRLYLTKSQTLNDLLVTLTKEGIVISDIYREQKSLKDIVYGEDEVG